MTKLNNPASVGWGSIILGVIVAIPLGIATEVLIGHTLFDRNPARVIVSWSILIVFLVLVFLFAQRKWGIRRLASASLQQPNLPWYKQFFAWCWGVAMGSAKFTQDITDGRSWKAAALHGLGMFVISFTVMVIYLHFVGSRPRHENKVVNPNA
jgi:hypothetical protein